MLVILDIITAYPGNSNNNSSSNSSNSSNNSSSNNNNNRLLQTLMVIMPVVHTTTLIIIIIFGSNTNTIGINLRTATPTTTLCHRQKRNAFKCLEAGKNIQIQVETQCINNTVLILEEETSWQTMI